MPTSAPQPPARRRGGRRGGDADTRGDILRAAREHFAQGYEATSVRAVARAADVDPSLIVQFFGGKDGLFKAVLDEAVQPDEGVGRVLADDGGTDLGQRLAAYFFGMWEDPARRHPFQAMLVSAASNEAAATVLREFVRGEVIARIGAMIEGDDAELRAELAGSQLIGAALVRYVYRIPPLCDAPLSDVVGRVGRAVQSHLAG
ncbi:TetR family transcriptional regulator [Streptomyces sp. NPDC020983]|uniref:TetR/AcrR family transcriptional regulator n=1 Tax=Streptomyces sp. NPDC020983 TaxID=3365106 RepID=UPI00378B5302